MLHLRNINQTLGKRKVISELSINVPQGKIYGFLGRNGAGKSTVMKIILGLLKPDSGSVTVAGQSDNYLSRIGSLIENPSFYPNLTGAENIRYLSQLRSTPTRHMELLDLVGLTAHAHRKAGNYSLGMKQRLGIALALVGDPEILLLDEPTNGLDPEGIREIRELILSFSREMGKTVMVSSHILSEIENIADVVGIIHDGTLRFEGLLSDITGTASLVLDPLDSAAAARVLGYRSIPFDPAERGQLRLGYVDRQHTAALINGLVNDGVSLAGVQVDQRTLEDAFLSITQQSGALLREGVR